MCDRRFRQDAVAEIEDVRPTLDGVEDRVDAPIERLAAGELAGLRLGLLHGRLSPGEKEATMDAFRAGRLDVLVPRR